MRRFFLKIKNPQEAFLRVGKLCRYVASDVSILFISVYRSDYAHNKCAIAKHFFCDIDHKLREIFESAALRHFQKFLWVLNQCKALYCTNRHFY